MSIILAEDSIIINEINYNSADSLFPKDWVELYNVTTEPINIGNWIFKDDNDEHEFIIPDNQILPPDGYIVICDSLDAFNILFKDVDNAIGDFDFKIHRMGPCPTVKIPISLGIPKTIVRKSQNHSISDHATIFVTGQTVATSARFDFSKIFCK